MATVDSGTETLFSDDSPCDLGSPTGVCAVEDFENKAEELNARLAPPNIQPYSGVLEKGKVVIRPIAFKPALNPAARFGIAGERYGSTPILTRPGSRLTLYGSSNDLRQMNAHMNNYSLDRKLRSAASSPPLAMSSLTSLPHKLINYDSLESVRKSPGSTLSGSIVNKPSYILANEDVGSLLDLTPSPSDSGVSELEAALRDRDSELAYLRQTMEHNEQVIFRVYQEKERSWERELRRLKTVHENTLRTASQKALKMEQLMMMQNYQFVQEKKRLAAETQRANAQNEILLQEVEILRNKLEETEWNLCQKTGEISLLKSQLKDSQNEQTTKGHELLQMRNDFRDARELLEERERQLEFVKDVVSEKEAEIDELKRVIEPIYVQSGETERLRKEVQELREELSEVSMSEYEGLEPGRTQRQRAEREECASNGSSSREDLEIQRLNAVSEEATRHELVGLKSELDLRKREFEKERVVWAQEKEKVLRYQRQLQMNYVQMYRRTRALEVEVESLTIELELDKTGLKKLPIELTTQTIEL
ncbi:PREDICTED: leucine zipper putative tumor suppressor 2 homolog [Nicrophorus vespilloides]|uniref:Leucine zipper putative tumor suppressor 2 homolog n=1 Tax=Nicrophorus vespilloides TaxID=110193 RepID=A0ABM1NJH5_NICVS|nr:PREDICTED: leucine zipper putative tumor suppressor 2 homolog [Nicrophorus vespilloides]XP_017786975.1 PREDICTED: leucine zipper putative tumor suppressor 2 homolog [Nicrophorus vespilloides]